MYSHGFGTLFLAEAYGMTHRPEVREKLQKAVRLIIDTQNAEGGWRPRLPSSCHGVHDAAPRVRGFSSSPGRDPTLEGARSRS